MLLAAYALILSGAYAILFVVDRDAASALTILFIAAIVVPASADSGLGRACRTWLRRRRGKPA